MWDLVSDWSRSEEAVLPSGVEELEADRDSDREIAEAVQELEEAKSKSDSDPAARKEMIQKLQKLQRERAERRRELERARLRNHVVIASVDCRGTGIR